VNRDEAVHHGEILACFQQVMKPFGWSLPQALAMLEHEWREIVREHGDLSAQPYDFERDSRHEVRLWRYKSRLEQLVAAVLAECSPHADLDGAECLTRH
jgi:hypothetical protein